MRKGEREGEMAIGWRTGETAGVGGRGSDRGKGSRVPYVFLRLVGSLRFPSPRGFLTFSFVSWVPCVFLRENRRKGRGRGRGRGGKTQRITVKHKDK